MEIPGVDDDKLAEHLKGCKLDNKRFKKLFKLVTGMRTDSNDAAELVNKFADKCYKNEPKRDLARKQARQFLEALFGNLDDLLSLGAKKAIAKRIREIHELIKPVELNRNKSEKFNALDQGKTLDSLKADEIESSPIWTFKLDRFLVGPTLGVGGTATVKLAYDTKSKEQVALKILQPKFAHSAKKEIDILKKLEHENIIRIFECFDNVSWQKRRTTVFAIEYANGGELIEYLMYTSKFEAKLARWFFKKLVAGVEYCHGKDIVHRDLKHDNCLLGADFNLKITDFGFARRYFKDDKEQMKTAIGTAQYAAPEILAQKPYNEKVDIFSMGVMLFIALAGSQPWRKADPSNDRWYHWTYNKEWDKFWEYHGERSHQFEDDAKELLQGMLAHKAKKRWSIDDIKKCQWYQGKTFSDNEARKALKQRKREMDQKKFDASKRDPKTRKAIEAEQKDDEMLDEDQKKLLASATPPFCDKIKLPLTHFYTKDNAVIVLEKINNAVLQLRGDKGSEEDNKFELNFEVKFSPGLGKATYLVAGKANVYKESETSNRNLVVFSNNGDFTSRMYLPRVFNDMMSKIGYIRCDVKSKESADAEDTKEDS